MDLHPGEKMILTVAKSQLARGEKLPIDATEMLVMIIERLAGISDYMVEEA